MEWDVIKSSKCYQSRPLNLHCQTSITTQEHTSLTTTLLHDHVLVVAHDHTFAFIVQHGERAEARRDTRRTGNALRMVKLQQTLEKERCALETT